MTSARPMTGEVRERGYLVAQSKVCNTKRWYASDGVCLSPLFKDGHCMMLLTSVRLSKLAGGSNCDHRMLCFNKSINSMKGTH